MVPESNDAEFEALNREVRLAAEVPVVVLHASSFGAPAHIPNLKCEFVTRILYFIGIRTKISCSHIEIYRTCGCVIKVMEFH